MVTGRHEMSTRHKIRYTAECRMCGILGSVTSVFGVAELGAEHEHKYPDLEGLDQATGYAIILCGVTAEMVQFIHHENWQGREATVNRILAYQRQGDIGMICSEAESMLNWILEDFVNDTTTTQEGT